MQRTQAQLANVYIELRTTATPDFDLVCQRLQVPAADQERLRAQMPELAIGKRAAPDMDGGKDPLAELVKTDPKSIGVGQYQHDVNQTQLRKCLDRVSIRRDVPARCD